jgi:hypothetical protein
MRLRMTPLSVSVLGAACLTQLVAPAAVLAAEGASASGNSPTDSIVLIILGVTLGAVAAGVIVTRQLLLGEPDHPGMGDGDDVIWSGGRVGDHDPEPAPITEPFWKTAPAGPAPAGPAAPGDDVTSASAGEAQTPPTNTAAGGVPAATP